MVVAVVPAAGNYPRRLNKREAKVIEAAAAADGALVQVLTNKTIDGDVNTIQDLAVTSLKTVAGNADKVVMGTTTTGIPKFDKIVDANVDAAAAIAQSKLSLAITAAEVATVVGNADKVLMGTTGTGVPKFDLITNDNVDAAAAIASSKLADNVVREASGSLTSVDILALNAVPQQLIASPGVGKFIVVDQIQFMLDYGAAQYAADAGEDLTVQYATSNTAILAVDNDGDGFLLGAADAHRIVKPMYLNKDGSAALFDPDNADNEAIEVTIAAGEWLTGDSDIFWKIRYHVESMI